MKRLFRALYTVGSSRAVPPVVIGCFFLLYIGIAFFTDETLVTLIALTSKSLFLAGVFALLPLNSAARIVTETRVYLRRGRVLSGATMESVAELFDDLLKLDATILPSNLPQRLSADGYRVARKDGSIAAVRGWNLFPARILYLCGTFCLFTGILISLTCRVSERGALVEGAQLPASSGGGMVESIELAPSTGAILSKALTVIVVAPRGEGGASSSFGLYPPSIYNGAFLYPRYLGVGILMRLSAPDLQGVHEKRAVLNIYPAGKEDATDIPGSEYRIVVSLVSPDDGSDPYMTGRMAFHFKLLKGNQDLLSGSIPGGGEFVRDGYRIAFPDCRRLVITDFIRDYGVFLIWVSSLFFIAAGCIWMLLRTFFPRREMLFRPQTEGLVACSRAEGKRRSHSEVFHETLDLLESRKDETFLSVTGQE